MNISTKKIQILTTVAENYVCSAAQIRGHIFQPGQDKGGRQTRRFLAELLHQRLLCKTNCQVVNPHFGLSYPVYYPSRSGAEFLAMRTGEPRWLHTPTQTPTWQNLAHWVALTDLRTTFKHALAQQSFVTMPEWYNEFDTVEDSEDPSKRYRLYTVVNERPRRVVCVPDAAFLFEIGNYRKAFYIELERGTNAVARAAAEKTPGYAGLDKLHQRHFPSANLGFSVLMFAPNANWRDSLCHAFARKPGAEHWRFAAITDVKPDTLLTAPIFYRCDGKADSLVAKGN